MTHLQLINYLTEAIVDKMTRFLIEDFQLDIPQAMDVIYTSKVYELLSDSSNDLYVHSAAYVYELLKREYLKGTFIE